MTYSPPFGNKFWFYVSSTYATSDKIYCNQKKKKKINVYKSVTEMCHNLSYEENRIYKFVPVNIFILNLLWQLY